VQPKDGNLPQVEESSQSELYGKRSLPVISFAAARNDILGDVP
jgi:hypothetical protein